MAAQDETDTVAAAPISSEERSRSPGDFYKNFASLMKAAFLNSTAATGKPVEIWYQDEARVGQKGTHAYVWAPIGSCPLMVRDNRHDSVHLFGAICPARGVGAAIIMSAVNTEASTRSARDEMNEHLQEISTQMAKNAHAVLALDGAGWHQGGGDLQVPDNISLLHLPPYAPELNLMENVWEYLRSNKLCAIVWDTYDVIVRHAVKPGHF